ncbi:hypothetical protein EJB05_18447, partial [Eragrostis curvula]
MQDIEKVQRSKAFTSVLFNVWAMGSSMSAIARMDLARRLEQSLAATAISRAVAPLEHSQEFAALWNNPREPLNCRYPRIGQMDPYSGTTKN